jgi:hypothetical protein
MTRLPLSSAYHPLRAGQGKGSSGYAALGNVFKRITAGSSRAKKVALFASTTTKFHRLP